MRFVSARDLYFLAVVVLLKIGRWCPSRALRALLIRSPAFVAFRISRRKRRLTEKAISAACEVALSNAQKRALTKEVFYTFWRETFSLVPSAWEKSALDQVELCGVEHLRAALASGRGAILWETNSFGSRVLAKQVLNARGFAIHQVHASNHLGSGLDFDDAAPTWVFRRLISSFFARAEMAFLAEIIRLPRSDSLAFTRLLFDRLERNCIICIAGDGKIGQKLTRAPFLGTAEVFSPGPITLAYASGAALLPMFCLRAKNDSARLIIEPPIHIESHRGRARRLAEGVSQYVSLLESYVRKHPEQYYNWHSLSSPGQEDAHSERHQHPKVTCSPI